MMLWCIVRVERFAHFSYQSYILNSNIYTLNRTIIVVWFQGMRVENLKYLFAAPIPRKSQIQ